MQNEPPQVRSEFRLLFGGTGRVVVDLVSSEIHFEHCHTPRRFLADRLRGIRLVVPISTAVLGAALGPQ